MCVLLCDARVGDICVNASSTQVVIVHQLQKSYRLPGREEEVKALRNISISPKSEVVSSCVVFLHLFHQKRRISGLELAQRRSTESETESSYLVRSNLFCQTRGMLERCGMSLSVRFTRCELMSATSEYARKRETTSKISVAHIVAEDLKL